jgi:hypothetical protein
MILENLRTAGVQQAHKEGRITFTALTPWPGDLVCADGRYMEGDTEKRAAIFSGPNLALSNARTWSPLPARPAMPHSMS